MQPRRIRRRRSRHRPGGPHDPLLPRPPSPPRRLAAARLARRAPSGRHRHRTPARAGRLRSARARARALEPRPRAGVGRGRPRWRRRRLGMVDGAHRGRESASRVSVPPRARRRARAGAEPGRTERHRRPRRPGLRPRRRESAPGVDGRHRALPDLPRPVRALRGGRRAPGTGVGDRGGVGRAARPGTPRPRPPVLRRRPRRRRRASRPSRRPRRHGALPHAGVPGGVEPSLRRLALRCRRSAPRRRRRVSAARRGGPRTRHPRDRRPDHEPLRQRPRLVPFRVRSPGCRRG